MRWHRARHKLLVIMLSAAAMLLANRASAYFMDMASYKGAMLRTGHMLLSYPDSLKPSGAEGGEVAIIADMTEYDQRLTPFKDGDSISISFRTYLEGDCGAILVPRLGINKKGSDEGQVIIKTAINGGGFAPLETIDGPAGEYAVYGGYEELSPGHEMEFSYIISIEGLPAADELMLDLDFSICGVQKPGNEELIAPGSESQDIYTAIYEDHFDPVRDNVTGFTEYRDLGDAVRPDGSPASDSSSEHVLVVLSPNIVDKGSDEPGIRWFAVRDGKEQPIDTGEGGSIRLAINRYSISCGFRYEVWNRAGRISSDTIRLDPEDIFSEVLERGDTNG